MINAPEFTATVTLIPTVFDVWNGTLTPRLQFHYETDSWLRVHNEPWDKRDDYTKTDLSLYYETGDGRWYAEAWIRNIENEDVKVYGSCGERGNGAIGTPNATLGCGAIYAAPRTFGVTLGFRMQ